MANQPINEIRIGRVKATIWQNGTEDRPRHNVTFGRIYKDGDDWKSNHSFGRDDLLVLAKVADQAHSEIFRADAGGEGQRGPQRGRGRCCPRTGIIRDRGAAPAVPPPRIGTTRRHVRHPCL